MRSSLILAAGLVAGAAPLAAQAGRISYDTFALANGVRVIYSADHSTPIVSVDVWYNTGSRNERPGRSGFAHLFEHMMFQGSAHVKKSEHLQLVERAGGNVNGSTTEERTNFYETVPSNRLNLALWLEADRMRSLAITQENFENQRQTVKEERRLGVDNQPYAAAFQDGTTWPFDSTSCFPYAHTVIGSMDDLDSAKVADVQAFFDTYYAPNNATIAVVGDFQPADLQRLVTESFGSSPRHAAAAPVSCNWKLAPGPRTVAVSDAHANLPASIRFYRIGPHADADTPALELLNIILGQGESSRLNVSVVRHDQAAVQAGSFVPSVRRGPGVFVVFGISNQGISIDRVDTLLAAQVDSIRAGGVSADELTKAKNTARAGFVHGRETTIDKAEELHHYDLFHASIGEINTDLGALLNVTADDIRRVAAKYLDPANAVVVLVKPAAGQSGGGQ
jgi:predicted Zn-dependent peptidase